MNIHNQSSQSWLIVLLSLALGFFPLDGQAQKPTANRVSPDQHTTQVTYNTINIDGLDIFYREAGDPSKPTILLLHGFPTSSHMFRNLIPALADRFHLVAPDYPGFGQSSAPSVNEFNYTFDNLAGIIDKFTNTIGLKNYSLYVQDYGAPVGYRLALKHPERVTALLIQNGNAYEDGLKDFWNPIKAYWADGSQQHREALRVGLTPEATKSQYIKGVRDVSRISPDTWLHDQTLLGRPGIDEIMLDLFKDYGSNVELYPQFQQFFRTRRPPTLIVWGQNDEIFPADGAYAYLHDLPNAKLYLLDTGHFALEDKGDEIAMFMRDFLDRWLPGK